MANVRVRLEVQGPHKVASTREADDSVQRRVHDPLQILPDHRRYGLVAIPRLEHRCGLQRPIDAGAQDVGVDPPVAVTRDDLRWRLRNHPLRLTPRPGCLGAGAAGARAG